MGLCGQGHLPVAFGGYEPGLLQMFDLVEPLVNNNARLDLDVMLYKIMC